MSLDDFMAAAPVTEKKKSGYSLSQLASVEWLEYAMYTVENRAIPNMIDGLKSSQRFYLYSSLKSGRSFEKVSGVGGVVSNYGYQHGETSAMEAGQLMAAEWNNNLCIIEGQGSFGSRLIPSAAAPRYTKTRVHENFWKFFKDTDLAPEHADPEHEPPAFYLPVIPMVLVNGPKGIATGFATDIMPRHPKDVAKACREYMNKSKISKRVPVTFPSFRGTVDEVDGKFVCRGVFEKKGKTVLLISEVPYGFNRESYVKVLDKLEEKNDIVSYDDLCDSQGFRFEVKLKQNTSANWDDARIIKEFNLEKTFTENLTVIDHRGKLKVYEDERDLIKDFCEYRIGVLQDRIKLRIKEHDEEIRWLKVKMDFIKAVLDGDIVFKGKKKQEVEESIFNHTDAFGDDAERLLRMNIVSLTSEMVNELKEAIEKSELSLQYWKETTPNIQFIEDLKEL